MFEVTFGSLEIGEEFYMEDCSLKFKKVERKPDGATALISGTARGVLFKDEDLVIRAK